MSKKKIEPLTKIQQQISDLLYEKLSYMYCDNCRFDSEISEEESEEMDGEFQNQNVIDWLEL